MYHIAVNNIKAVTFIACILCGIAIYLAEHLPEVKESLVRVFCNYNVLSDKSAEAYCPTTKRSILASFSPSKTDQVKALNLQFAEERRNAGKTIVHKSNPMTFSARGG